MLFFHQKKGDKKRQLNLCFNIYYENNIEKNMEKKCYLEYVSIKITSS